MKAIGVRAEKKGWTHGRYRPALHDELKKSLPTGCRPHMGQSRHRLAGSAKHAVPLLALRIISRMSAFELREAIEPHLDNAGFGQPGVRFLREQNLAAALEMVLVGYEHGSKGQIFRLLGLVAMSAAHGVIHLTLRPQSVCWELSGAIGSKRPLT